MISVIIPVYNAISHLRECLDSLLKQDFDDFEIILIDDGSTDGSCTVCNEYAKNYSKVHSFHIKNSGASYARNYGIAKSKGEWITFVDADDIVSKNYCRSLFEATDLRTDFIIGRILSFKNDIFLDDGYALGNVEFSINKEQLYSSIFDDRKRPDYVPHVSCVAAKLVRRKILEQYNITFDSKLTLYEDAIFNIDIILKSRSVKCIDDIVYFYRLHSLSSSNSRCSVNQYSYLYRFIVDYDLKNKINFNKSKYYFFVKNLNTIFINASVKGGLNVRLVKDAMNVKEYKSSLWRVRLFQLPKRRFLLVFLLRFHLHVLVPLMYKFL